MKKDNKEKIIELFKIEELQERLEFSEWTPDSGQDVKVDGTTISAGVNSSGPNLEYNSWGAVI